MSFKLTWKSHVICFLISIILMILLNSFIDALCSDLFAQNIIFCPTKNLIVNFYVLTIFLMVPISIVHEGIHGAAYKLFGGKVRFGFKVIYAYTMEISEMKIPRNKFFVILLSPLIIISILSMLLPAWLGEMVFLLNLLGASGDIYMALFLCKFNYKSKIIDRCRLSSKIDPHLR